MAVGYWWIPIVPQGTDIIQPKEQQNETQGCTRNDIASRGSEERLTLCLTLLRDPAQSNVCQRVYLCSRKGAQRRCREQRLWKMKEWESSLSRGWCLALQNKVWERTRIQWINILRRDDPEGKNCCLTQVKRTTWEQIDINRSLRTSVWKEA